MGTHGKVLSLCDYTGNMIRPWLEAGYECWTVDLQHSSGAPQAGPWYRVCADVRNWTPPPFHWDVVFAFPPCTHLAVSGARWFKGKGLRALSEAIDIFGACVNICQSIAAPWMVENPVSTISSHWRKPDFTFDPCDYGDPYTKRTCLWAGNGFSLPPKHSVVPVEGSKMYRLPPGPERSNLRSATPMGFAYAVFAHMNPGKEATCLEGSP